MVTADPAEGWAISGWDGTDDDVSTTPTHTVMMPASSQAFSWSSQPLDS